LKSLKDEMAGLEKLEGLSKLDVRSAHPYMASMSPPQAMIAARLQLRM